MSNEIIESHYETLRTISGRFQQHTEVVQQTLQQLTTTLEELRNRGYMGEDAEVLFSKMDEEVLPQVKRFGNALDLSSQTIHNIASRIEEAEEHAANQVSKQESGGGTGTPDSSATGSPVVYTVVPGDNLTRIAERYGTTVAELVAANNIANPNLIYPGQQLIIPGQYTPSPGGSMPSGTLTDFQRQFVGQKSNRMQGWGCVAYVLDNAYVPWATPSSAPGNANEWVAKARAFAAAHPEYGITIDQTPRPGSILCQTGGGSGYGHVGIVDNTNGNSYLLRSADTWQNGQTCPQGGWFNENSRWETTRGDRWFIHFPWMENS